MDVDSIGYWALFGPRGEREEYSGVLDCLNRTYQRLKAANEELGMKPQKWGLAMNEQVFRAFDASEGVIAEPPSIMLDGDALPVFFSFPVPKTPLEGVKGWSSDIWIRPLEELERGDLLLY